MNFTTLRFETLGSTNTEAAEQARKGASEGLCIVADEQTQGKGRQGRAWTSHEGMGLYMSLVLRPKVDPQYLSLITLGAALAVHDVLAKGYLVAADIKWPNDIMVGGKKLCGILAETVDTSKGLAVILGIGVNLATPADDNATSLGAVTQFRVSRDELLEALLPEIAKYYALIQTSPVTISDTWSDRSSYARGMSVRVTLSTGLIEGVTDGLERSGALRVKLSDGSVTVVHAGDVERLRPSSTERS